MTEGVRVATPAGLSPTQPKMLGHSFTLGRKPWDALVYKGELVCRDGFIVTSP